MKTCKLPHSHGDNPLKIEERIPGVEAFSQVSDIFKEISDSSRIRIFWLLCHCEECVTNISAMVGMSPPAVSHHLARLKKSGLIEARRSGKEVYYKASEDKAAQLLHHMIEDMVEIACPEETPVYLTFPPEEG